MNRYTWAAPIAFLFILAFAGRAAACDLRLTPGVFAVGAGDRVTFKLERYQTHSRCLLPLEETSIRVTGGKLVDPGIWRTGRPDVLEFTVEFTSPGEARVTVERNCAKGLITAAAGGSVTVRQAAAPPLAAPAAPIVLPDAPESYEAPKTPPAQQAGLDEGASAGGGGEPGETPASPVDKKTSAADTEAVGSSCTDCAGEDCATDATAAWSQAVAEAGWWLGFIALGLVLHFLRLRRFRTTILFLGLVWLGFYLGGCPDPIGALFNLAAGARSKLPLYLILLLVPAGVSLLWGRVFCGWVCPLGAAQELIHGRRGKRAAIPPGLDRALKYVKFATLAALFYLSWRLGRNIFCEYEPFKALFNLGGTPWLLAGLGLILVAAILVERPFCRYLCPLGAVLTLTSLLAPRRIRLDEGACTKCRACAKDICPMGAIQPSGPKEPPRIDAGECIACQRCLDACRAGALGIGGGKRLWSTQRTQEVNSPP